MKERTPVRSKPQAVIGRCAMRTLRRIERNTSRKLRAGLARGVRKHDP